MKNPFKFSYLKVSLREKILFVKNLSISIKSGMTLYAAVQMIREQTASRSFKKILDNVLIDISNGVYLSKSLEKYHNIFGNLFINLVRVGEDSGTLPQNLNYLGEELQKTDAFRKKIKAAMIYPVIVLVATVIVTTILLVFLMPKILPVFEALHVDLPLPTIIVIAASNLLTNYGLWVLVGVLAFIMFITLIIRVPRIGYLWHYSFFYLPVLRGAVVQVNIASISRTLGILLKSGTKIIEAIDITSQVIPNLVYRKELEATSLAVQKGDFFNKHLHEHPQFFPPTFSNLIAVGENTGNLVENLSYLSEFYEKDVDDFMKNISTVVEPLLLLILGFTVGFIALATILPIYQITKGI